MHQNLAKENKKIKAKKVKDSQRSGKRGEKRGAGKVTGKMA